MSVYYYISMISWPVRRVCGYLFINIFGYNMGINRDSRHKRRLTGGRMPIHKKKRAFEKARQPANTKLGEKRVRSVRVMGGNLKRRALRMNEGNFNW